MVTPDWQPLVDIVGALAAVIGISSALAALVSILAGDPPDVVGLWVNYGLAAGLVGGSGLAGGMLESYDVNPLFYIGGLQALALLIILLSLVRWVGPSGPHGPGDSGGGARVDARRPAAVVVFVQTAVVDAYVFLIASPNVNSPLSLRNIAITSVIPPVAVTAYSAAVHIAERPKRGTGSPVTGSAPEPEPEPETRGGLAPA